MRVSMRKRPARDVCRRAKFIEPQKIFQTLSSKRYQIHKLVYTNRAVLNLKPPTSGPGPSPSSLSTSSSIYHLHRHLLPHRRAEPQAAALPRLARAGPGADADTWRQS
jgi:hypothetical protein